MADGRPLALVTGASSGIGFELAKLFADDGYDLVVAADDDAIHASADKLAAGGTAVRAVQVDLRKEDEVDRLYSSATEGGRRLDAVALNAGTGGAGRFVDRGLEEDLNIIDLNVRGTTQLAKFVLADMVGADSGKLLFTSSIVAAMPGSYQTVYNASKSFVQSFAEALQDELRDTGVTITSLMPGPTDTNFFRRAGMLDTLVGRMPKDDPGKTAKEGYDALMRGDKKVVASSPLSKAMGLVNRVLPDSVKAASNRLISK
ncbi:SDR family NAD(P)-dependent oxidoreductase [Mycolicibacterium celeriflavum]|uniref:Oxidoreductase n=1 Tax=Mycolicibacterium celeriflavum TaxID=1249101 RepID=A0A1X0BLM9_MYCCF|nr:SDR family NAD(P)-dependent oxidoreductase [Mycolicibacterium celeriflavum]MCV7237966.1 SDR family NAD(P)-dependent oxidoreductase [Mycolicibacterium celeriflavum]ORA43696.1 oxidoreductase [Mycolicibacterium celeriflavum]BBY46032.1 oxidoreductase [Mycolicibacterium celeriflavum]